MGKGDRKTGKGKIAIGSYGVRRPRNKNVTDVVPSALEKPKSKSKK